MKRQGIDLEAFENGKVGRKPVPMASAALKAVSGRFWGILGWILLAIAFVVSCGGPDLAKEKAPDISGMIRTQTEVLERATKVIEAQQKALAEAGKQTGIAGDRIDKASGINGDVTKVVSEAPPESIIDTLRKMILDAMGVQKKYLVEAKGATTQSAAATTQASTQAATISTLNTTAVGQGKKNEVAGQRAEDIAAAAQAKSIKLEGELKEAKSWRLWLLFFIGAVSVAIGAGLYFGTPIKGPALIPGIGGAALMVIAWFFLEWGTVFGWILLAAVGLVVIFAVLKLTGVLKNTFDGVEKIKHDPEMPAELVGKYFGSPERPIGYFHWLHDQAETIVGRIRKAIGSKPRADVPPGQ